MGVKYNRRPKFPWFLMLSRDMINHCDEWKQLSPSAKIAYICIKARHNGSNNGKISLPYSELETVKGLGSPSTVSSALKELVKKGWIRKTQLGGLFRYRNQYEMTGKYDPNIADRPLPPPEDYITSTVAVASKHDPIPAEPTIQRNNIGDRAAPPPAQVPENEEPKSGSRS
jgi:hypothetical protein